MISESLQGLKDVEPASFQPAYKLAWVVTATHPTAPSYLADWLSSANPVRYSAIHPLHQAQNPGETRHADLANPLHYKKTQHNLSLRKAILRPGFQL